MASSDKDYWYFRDRKEADERQRQEQQAAADRRRMEQAEREKRESELSRMRQREEESRQMRFRELEGRRQQQANPGRRYDPTISASTTSGSSTSSEGSGGCILVALAVGLLAGLGYFILMRPFLWIPLGVGIAFFFLWSAWKSSVTARYMRSIWRWAGVALLAYLAVLTGQLMYWWWARTHQILIAPSNLAVNQPAVAHVKSRSKRTTKPAPPPTPTDSSP